MHYNVQTSPGFSWETRSTSMANQSHLIGLKLCLIDQVWNVSQALHESLKYLFTSNRILTHPTSNYII